jgi:hypothetical protein
MRYWLVCAFLILFIVGCGAKSDDFATAKDASATTSTADTGTNVAGTAQAMTAQAADRAPSQSGADMQTRRAAGEGGPAAAPRATPISQETQVTVHRAVIRNASLTVRVKNVEQAEKKADQFVTRCGGYVEGTESNDLSSSDAEITMTLRVPVSSFDDAILDFEGLGTRINKKISGEDVTGKMLDYDARLKTMRTQEEVYRNLLKESRGLDAVLEMQQKLMELREEIESTTAQLKGLSELSALSTIQLTLSQSMEAVVARPQDAGWAGEAWAGAEGAGFAFYRMLVVVAMWLVVFCPVWLGGLLLVRWMVKSAGPRAVPPVPPMQP